jgi:hypothetical protein
MIGWTKLRAITKQLGESLGVEQEVHPCFSPSQKESGNGALKSSLIQTSPS